MNKKELTDMGKDIKKIVNESINSGDYSKLGKEVGSTVNTALEATLEEVRKTVNNIQKEFQDVTINIDHDKKKMPVTKQSSTKVRARRPKRVSANMPANKAYTAPNQLVMKRPGTYVARPTRRRPKSEYYFPHVPKGRGAAVTLSIFGGMGTVGFGITVLVLGLVGAPASVVGGMMVGLLISLGMDFKGASLGKRIKRYRRYLSFFENKPNVALEDLAAYSGNTPKYVYKDIRKMIDLGMFPQAQFNPERDRLFLNHASYDKYKLEINEHQERLLAIEARGFSEEQIDDINDTVLEGKRFIQEVERANSQIQDPEVSEKVSRMETIIRQITDYIEVHPHQTSEVRRLIQFYLPTTVKLLDAYDEFEKQPIEGDNIKKAKGEIKGSLDMINTAFENLYDSLFASSSMDISADISVLKTMLAEEGLTKQELVSDYGQDDELVPDNDFGDDEL